MHAHTIHMCIQINIHTPLTLVCTLIYTYMYICTHKVAPQRKRAKQKKQWRAFDSFIKYQAEADECFQKQEEEGLSRQVELEEKRQHENREHELRIIQMLMQGFQRGSYYDYSTGGGYIHDY